MNRTRRQVKAAKARKEWQNLQDQKLKEEQTNTTPKLKKVKSIEKEDSLQDSA